MAEEQDPLDSVQGRWKTSENENVVVEADQVWMLGDSAVAGILNVDVVESEPVVTFTLSGDANADAITGRFGDKGSMIMWSDGDTWKKMAAGSAEVGVAVQSTSGKNVGRLSQIDKADAEGIETEQRRWTKNGQRGSEQDKAQQGGAEATPVAA